MMNEEGRAVFEKAFNPEDISAWFTTLPADFIMTVRNEIGNSTQRFEAWSKLLLERPVADEVAVVLPDGKAILMREILEWFVEYTTRMQRLMKVSAAYADYLRQQANTKDSD